ncbi:hypothetical protein LWI29_020502 [Acer saccharum]|uniref:Cyclic nucleotide-binding domain-containing protein n=1 Tax=Acer saccharum TaxID=4024 RepID=A0AA39SFD1_ACESA|nr:hypothetical protein LWI29_020502 [Acer saccharum]
MECWSKACRNHSGCHYADHRFLVSSADNKFLNNICFTKTEDTKIYELGIFKDALESHIAETTRFWKKFLYCFRGVQNLRLRTFEGVVKHLCFIYVIVSSQLHVYAERSYIVREGDLIDKMLFVLQGKLWTFSSKVKSTDGSTNSNVGRESGKDLLKDGEFWGEELVNWVQNEPSSNKLVSNRTVQALNKIEAFVLTSDDLKNFYNQKAEPLLGDVDLALGGTGVDLLDAVGGWVDVTLEEAVDMAED